MNKILIKNIIKQLSLCLILFSIVSCTEDKHEKEIDSTSSVSTASSIVTAPVREIQRDTVVSISQTEPGNTTKAEKMELESFTSIPDEFIGCGCSFFRTKIDKEAQKYIYIDAGNIAMVNLNGAVNTLDYTGKIKGRTYYTNISMQLVVDITKTVKRTDLEETADVEGTFTITKREEKLVQKFIGSCGC